MNMDEIMTHFEEPGKTNTRQALELGFDRGSELGLNEVVDTGNHLQTAKFLTRPFYLQALPVFVAALDLGICFFRMLFKPAVPVKGGFCKPVKHIGKIRILPYT